MVTFMQPGAIRRVALVGGTHGNEWTGVYLIQKFQQSPDLVRRTSFETLTLLANPGAIAVNRRYLERDLNRCFASQDLANPDLLGPEDQLAKAIALQLGPKSTPHADVIIDLHSTTANMGLSILPASRDAFNLQFGAYLMTQDSMTQDSMTQDSMTQNAAVRVCCGLQCGQETPLLRSLSPWGCTLEVGPIAQGLLQAELWVKTEQMIYTLLDYFDAINQGNPPPAEMPREMPGEMTLYQAIATVDYPRNSAGELLAMVHPQIQGQDYQPLVPGQPMFLGFDGQVIPYEGESVVYPVFINEAAYYEKNIALVLTQREKVPFKVV
jgi:succinylglutamate desuccinylase